MADNEKKKRTLWEQAVENALRFAFNPVSYTHLTLPTKA